MAPSGSPVRSQFRLCFFLKRVQAQTLTWNSSSHYRDKSAFSVLASRFWKQQKIPLELEGVAQFQVYIGNLEVPVCFVIANKPSVDIHVRSSFKDRYVRDIFFLVQTVMLRNWKPVYISKTGCKSENKQVQFSRITLWRWWNHRPEQDARCKTDSDTTEIGTTCACSDPRGQTKNYGIKISIAGKTQVVVARDVAYILSLVFIEVSVAKFQLNQFTYRKRSWSDIAQSPQRYGGSLVNHPVQWLERVSLMRFLNQVRKHYCRCRATKPLPR